MPRYAWIVTRNALAGKDVRVIGPSGATPEQIAKLDAGEGAAFRLLDDDGEVNYLGRFLGDPKSQEAFGPLDDYGEPDSGCTGIQYREGGRWEYL